MTDDHPYEFNCINIIDTVNNDTVNIVIASIVILAYSIINMNNANNCKNNYSKNNGYLHIYSFNDAHTRQYPFYQNKIQGFYLGKYENGKIVTEGQCYSSDEIVIYYKEANKNSVLFVENKNDNKIILHKDLINLTNKTIKLSNNLIWTIEKFNIKQIRDVEVKKIGEDKSEIFDQKAMSCSSLVDRFQIRNIVHHQ